MKAGGSGRKRVGWVVRKRGRAALLVAGLALGGCASTPPGAGPVPAADRGGSSGSVRAAQPVSPDDAEAVFDTAWARIDRSYYDTTFHGVDWAAVRNELRPRAREAGTVDSLRAVLRDMISRLGDSHFAIIPARAADAFDPDSLTAGAGEPGYVGAEVRVLEGAMVVTRVDPGSPAEAAGIRTGWVVEKVAGTPAATYLDALDALGDDRRVGEARVAWAVEARMAGAVGDTVALTLRDGRDATVERAVVSGPRRGTPVRFGNLPTQFADLESREIPAGDGCVGLIAFDVWMTPVLPAFEKAFLELRHCDGFVLDLRGNPGGVGGMVMAVSGYFMDERKPLGTMITRQSRLDMVSMPRRVTLAGEPLTPYPGPVALLVDGQSMSTSEIFAEGMQGLGRARVFGETTGGQALPALMSRLPNRDVLMHAFANFVGPDGTRVEGRGVLPDVVVPRTRRDLLAGVDAPLEAALRWIKDRAGRP